MRSFLFTVYAFFFSLHLFLYWRLRPGLGGWRRFFCFWCVALVMLALPLLFHPRIEGLRSLVAEPRVAELLFAGSFTWVAMVGLACLAFAALDVVNAFLWLWGRLDGVPRGLSAALRIKSALVLSVALIGYSAFEAWDIRQVTFSLPTEKLPDGVDRLRIVQIADVHLGGFFGPRRLEKLMEIVRAAEPDLFVSTGDLVDGTMNGREREARLLASHGARLGAFAVTGNHEFYAELDQALRFTEEAGFRLLRNRKEDVAGIVVAGVDDPGFNLRDRETRLLKNFPKNRFVLFLRHRPYVMPSSEGRFDLQLSGHLHGGQIWPFGYVVEYVNKAVSGLSFKGESAVYVSKGSGFWGPPLRFLAPPEVTVIDLVRPPLHP